MFLFSHHVLLASYTVLSDAHYRERRMELKLSDMIEEHYGLSKLPKDTAYAMAYVPFQQENAKVFLPDQGFSLGTMYPSLNKPFYGSKCGDNID